MTEATASCWITEKNVSASRAFHIPSTANSSGMLCWRTSRGSRSNQKFFGMIPLKGVPSAASHFSHRPTMQNTAPPVRRMCCVSRKPNMPENGGKSRKVGAEKAFHIRHFSTQNRASNTITPFALEIASTFLHN